MEDRGPAPGRRWHDQARCRALRGRRGDRADPRPGPQHGLRVEPGRLYPRLPVLRDGHPRLHSQPHRGRDRPAVPAGAGGSSARCARAQRRVHGYGRAHGQRRGGAGRGEPAHRRGGAPPLRKQRDRVHFGSPAGHAALPARERRAPGPVPQRHDRCIAGAAHAPQPGLARRRPPRHAPRRPRPGLGPPLLHRVRALGRSQRQRGRRGSVGGAPHRVARPREPDPPQRVRGQSIPRSD